MSSQRRSEKNRCSRRRSPSDKRSSKVDDDFATTANGRTDLRVFKMPFTNPKGLKQKQQRNDLHNDLQRKSWMGSSSIGSHPSVRGSIMDSRMRANVPYHRPGTNFSHEERPLYGDPSHLAKAARKRRSGTRFESSLPNNGRREGKLAKVDHQGVVENSLAVVPFFRKGRHNMVSRVAGGTKCHESTWGQDPEVIYLESLPKGYMKDVHRYRASNYDDGSRRRLAARDTSLNCYKESTEGVAWVRGVAERRSNSERVRLPFCNNSDHSYHSRGRSYYYSLGDFDESDTRFIQEDQPLENPLPFCSDEQDYNDPVSISRQTFCPQSTKLVVVTPKRTSRRENTTPFNRENGTGHYDDGQFHQLHHGDIRRSTASPQLLDTDFVSRQCRRQGNRHNSHENDFLAQQYTQKKSRHSHENVVASIHGEYKDIVIDAELPFQQYQHYDQYEGFGKKKGCMDFLSSRAAESSSDDDNNESGRKPRAITRRMNKRVIVNNEEQVLAAHLPEIHQELRGVPAVAAREPRWVIMRENRCLHEHPQHNHRDIGEGLDPRTISTFDDDSVSLGQAHTAIVHDFEDEELSSRQGLLGNLERDDVEDDDCLSDSDYSQDFCANPSLFQGTEHNEGNDFVICHQNPKPKIQYCNIPRYYMDRTEAPSHEQYIAIETTGSIEDAGRVHERLLDTQINRVDLMERGNIGCYISNNLHRRTHYSIHGDYGFKTYYERLRALNLEHSFTQVRRKQKPRIFQDEHDNYVVVANGHHYDEFILSMNLKEVAHDALFPNMGEVPVRNTARGNRGFSLGFTGNQGCCSVAKSCTEGLSEPVLMKGSARYSLLFVKMTKLLEMMINDHRLPKAFISNDQQHHGGNDLSKSDARLDLFARKIHPDNKLESISVLCMIEDHEKCPDINDVLHEHRDTQNCSRMGWNNCLVVYERFFVESIGRWATVILSATSRRSVSDFLKRQKIVTQTGEKLWAEYQAGMRTMQLMDASLLCKDAKHDKILDGVHYEPSLHYSPLIFHVQSLAALLGCHIEESDKEDCRLIEKVDGGLEMGLVHEMVYAFFLTNNALRFHSFCCQIGSEMEGKKKLTRILRGRFNFTIEFLRFAYSTFGAWNGTKNAIALEGGCVRKSVGAVRYQSSSNFPLTNAALEDSLRCLQLIVENTIKVEPSMASYKKYTKQIQERVQGIGRLCSQKIMHVYCYLGILKSGWLHYCVPGSNKHFHSLKENHNFETPSQVDSLIRFLAAKGDVDGRKMTLTKSEEILCNLMKTNRKRFRDVIPYKCNLYYCRWKLDGSSIEIRYVDYREARDDLFNKKPTLVPMFRRCYKTNWELGSGYTPVIWSPSSAIPPPSATKYFQNSSVMASLSSTENKFLASTRKRANLTGLGAKMKAYFEELDIRGLQSLLNTGKYIVLSKETKTTLLLMLAHHWQVHPNVLNSKIDTTGSTAEGYVANFNHEFIQELELTTAYQPPGNLNMPLQLNVHRHSVAFKRDNQGATTGYRFLYQCSNTAIHALLLHALLTFRRQNCMVHWLDKYENRYDEAVILYPDQRIEGAVHCIGVFYIHVGRGETDYLFRMIDPDSASLSETLSI